MIRIAQPIPSDHLTKVSHFAIDNQTDLDDKYLVHCDFTACTRLTVDASVIDQGTISGARLRELSLVDTKVAKLEAAGLQAYEARFSRAEFSNSRMTGLDIAEGEVEDCTFKDVKLDEAGFKASRQTRVSYENCDLRNADFSGAKLKDISFIGCDLEGAHFDNATCKNVDLRQQQLSTIHGIGGLRGSLITYEQVVQLAPLLAAENGFRIEDYHGN